VVLYEIELWVFDDVGLVIYIVEEYCLCWLFDVDCVVCIGYVLILLFVCWECVFE